MVHVILIVQQHKYISQDHFVAQYHEKTSLHLISDIIKILPNLIFVMVHSLMEKI